MGTTFSLSEIPTIIQLTKEQMDAKIALDGYTQFDINSNGGGCWVKSKNDNIIFYTNEK